jgi:hypothetical protein
MPCSCTAVLGLQVKDLATNARCCECVDSTCGLYGNIRNHCRFGGAARRIAEIIPDMLTPSEGIAVLIVQVWVVLNVA